MRIFVPNDPGQCSALKKFGLQGLDLLFNIDNGNRRPVSWGRLGQCTLFVALKWLAQESVCAPNVVHSRCFDSMAASLDQSDLRSCRSACLDAEDNPPPTNTSVDSKDAVEATRKRNIKLIMERVMNNPVSNTEQMSEALSGRDKRTRQVTKGESLESVATVPTSYWTAMLFGLCAEARLIEPLAANLEKLCGGSQLTLKFMDLRKSTRANAMRIVLDRVKLEMESGQPFMLLVEMCMRKAEALACLETKLLAELIKIPNVCMDLCNDRVMTVYRIAIDNKYILRLITPDYFLLAKINEALAVHFAQVGHRAYFRTFRIQLRPGLPALNVIVSSASARESTLSLMAAHSWMHCDRHISVMLRVGPGGHGGLQLGVFHDCVNTQMVLLNDCTLFPVDDGFYHQSLKDKQLRIRTGVTRSAEPPRHQVRQKDPCPRKEEPMQTEEEMVQRLAAATAKNYLKKLLSKLELELNRLRKIETEFIQKQKKQQEWEEGVRKQQEQAGVRFATHGKPRGPPKNKKGCKHGKKKPQGKSREPQAECTTLAPPVCVVSEELAAPKATGSPSTSGWCDGGFGRLIHNADPVERKESRPFVQNSWPLWLRKPLKQQFEQIDRWLDVKDRENWQEGLLHSLELRDALPLHDFDNSHSLDWLEVCSQEARHGSDAGSQV